MTLTSTPSYSLLKMSSQVRAGARPQTKTKMIGGEANARGDAQWEARLAQLEAYMRTHGDCNVPQAWAEAPGLLNWVYHQRKLKKKLDRGDPSQGMGAARAAKLDALGFAWEGSKTDDAGWQAQLAKLKQYKRRHGDCNVPKGWAEDPPLGSWVNKQRKGKLKLDRGEPSLGMTAARAAQLDKLGFNWSPPKGPKPGSCM